MSRGRFGEQFMGRDDRATWVRYQVLAAGCLLAVLTYVQRLGFSRALPKIRDSLELTDEHSGYLTAAFLIAYGGFQVFGGLLGDRFGARHLLTALVLGWSLLTGVVGLTTQLPAGLPVQFAFLIVVRFLFGMLQAGGFPVWARVVADWMPVQERGLAQGVIWTFSRLGGAVSGFIFLWLFDYFGTWTTPFWVLAGLGVLWCGLFWPWFRNRPHEMKSVNAGERKLIAAGRPTAPVVSVPVGWSRMLSSSNVWGLCLMYGFVGFSGNFITGLLPDYLTHHRHLTSEDTTWVFGLTLAGGMVSCVLGGYLSDRIIAWTGNRKWGRRVVGAVGLVFAGAAFLVVPWVPNLWWILAIVFAAAFFGNDLTMGPAWAACADIGERDAGTLSGAMNMIGAFLGAAGAALAGLLLRRNLELVLFLVFACSYGLAALCWLAVDVTRPLDRNTGSKVPPS